MITTILEVGLCNALVATILAAIAFVVTRRMRPQWALAVWLLVLAKLLMPPLWTAPLTSLRTAAPLDEPAEFVAWNGIEQPTAFSAPDSFTMPDVTAPDIPFEATPLDEPIAERPSTPVSLPAMLLVVWGLGTLCWSVLAARRIQGFNRLLKNTRRAPTALQAEIDLLAAEIGLRRAPTLRITRCRIAPLVWGFARRTTILLPVELLEQLSADERRALVLHELTHLRRRDHWTKILELAAVGLYWWLPVAWWARRQADRAAEGCCDAEVVARLPELSRGYASALVKTIDYLSELSQPLPLGASGFSQFGLVSRRIEMILQPSPVRRATWKSRLAIVLVGLCVLPVSFRSLWAEPPAVEPATPVAPPVTSQLPEIDAELAAQQKADLEYVPPKVEEEPKVHVEGTQNLSLAASLMYAKHVARVKAVNRQYFGQESLQRAKDEIAKLEQQADTEPQQRLLKTRDDYRSEFALREQEFAAGDLPDRLIGVQRDLSNAEAALAQALCPDTYAGEVLRMQANVQIAVDATNRSRATWRVVHDRALANGDPANVLAEAIAREHFYRCKQQLQNVMQAAVGDFGQLTWKENTERDMIEELQAARAVEWRTEPISGPVTVGPKLTQLDPPSDGEVMQVLRRRLRAEGRSQVGSDIQIVKQLRTTYADNPRAYPGVGSAQRHHVFYKCTVGYLEPSGEQRVEVLYIDHQHLHRFAEQEQTRTEPAPVNRGAEPARTPAGGQFVSSPDAGKDWVSNEGVSTDKQSSSAESKPPTSDPKSNSVRPRSEVATHFQAEMDRIPIAGPVTTGEKVTPLAPPSDEEIVEAMAGKSGKLLRSLTGKNHRIAKEQVATYTDPPKWHPMLLSKAQRHHAHYKCTIYYDDPDGKPQEKVVYVDHNHLHRKADPRTFDEFQSGPFHYKFARGFTKQVAQYRHYQLQLAREQAKLADLKEQIEGAPTPEQQAELSRLEMRVAARQLELDAAAGIMLRSALSPVVPSGGISFFVGQER